VKLIGSTLVTGIVTLAFLVPTAAHADTYVHPDATGDVVSVKKVSGATTPAPEQVEGDIVRTRVRHKAHRVVLKMRVRDLTQTGRGTVHYYSIRTKKLTRIVTVQAKPGDWDGTVTMLKPNGRRTHCHVSHRIDYTLNWARISVPRSCLNWPRWVKAAMEEITVNAANVGYADDSQTDGQIYNRPVYGPRVRR
jgi:hypothetical protein